MVAREEAGNLPRSIGMGSGDGLRGRERDAAEILVARYADRLYRLAIRITGSEQDAEEVVQDALWTATRKIDTFRGDSALGTWLHRIAVNAANQKRRARRSRRNEVSRDDLFPSFGGQDQPGAPASDWSAKMEDPRAADGAAEGVDLRHR